MKTRITFIICLCLFAVGRASAQWAVIDPSNIAQSIVNTSKNVVHTSTTAQNMIKNFQETVKIYEQGKKYYDALKSVNNLVKDARKVQQTILMVGDITDTYRSDTALFGTYDRTEICIINFTTPYQHGNPSFCHKSNSSRFGAASVVDSAAQTRSENVCHFYYARERIK